jgi:hypothetical protein
VQCDLDIHDMISAYTPNPVMVIIDVQARAALPFRPHNATRV